MARYDAIHGVLSARLWDEANHALNIEARAEAAKDPGMAEAFADNAEAYRALATSTAILLGIVQ